MQMVAQEMDIAARFNLRTVNKHNKTIHRALWLAFIAHVFAWFYWHPVQRVTAPELPDWINITLVAGIEEQQAEPAPQVTPQPPKPRTFPVKQVKKKPTVKPQQKIIPVEKIPPPQETIEEEVKPASASTFVQADSKPFALDNPKPVYPSAARRRGMQGIVLLQVMVSDKGAVSSIHIMRNSGFKVLDISAVNTVKQWRFMPARQGSDNVASTVQVPIRFILNNS